MRDAVAKRLSPLRPRECEALLARGELLPVLFEPRLRRDEFDGGETGAALVERDARGLPEPVREVIGLLLVLPD